MHTVMYFLLAREGSLRDIKIELGLNKYNENVITKSLFTTRKINASPRAKGCFGSTTYVQFEEIIGIFCHLHFT